MRVVLTEAAAADLESIADWIAADNPGRALSFVTDLRDACGALADQARAWPLVPRYERHGVRRRALGAYLIFFRAEANAIVILRVLHGARDYEPLLFPEG
ncbi:MAG: type II toxin-antitoxin system RelE/ParE family toxin [Caulobacteraceae bacterium]|nr:type II toxin-antitoxin system RelE/ParE family toxin [Caulobacteraceae bacterium]